MKTIDAVRPYPELYDDAHPHAKDEAHINALWEQLKEDTKIECKTCAANTRLTTISF